MVVNNVRQAQLISPNGVGAIFDVEGQSFVVESTENWFTSTSNRHSVDSPRLSKILGVRNFYEPPVGDADRRFGSNWVGPSVPVTRFPAWLFCGVCRKMTAWRSSMEDLNPNAKCPSCQAQKKSYQLVPMRWVQVCEAGHLGDIDWVWFAHANGGSDCVKKDGLRFEQTSVAGVGLGAVEVRCSYCRAARPLSDITDRMLAQRLGLRCTGRHPWEYYDKEHPVSCDKPPRAVQRRASNVYYPDVVSAIEVPFTARQPAPEDAKVLSHPVFDLLCDAVAVEDDSLREQYAFLLSTISGAPVGHVVHMAQGRTKSAGATEEGALESVNLAEIVGSEWTAFTARGGIDNDDFVSRNLALSDGARSSAEQALVKRIPRVTLADSLREVRVFQGFRRVSPSPSSTFIRADGRRIFDRPPVEWLPAIEVRGEGIFLELDQEALSLWEVEESVVRRVEELNRRAQNSVMWHRMEAKVGARVTPRYALAHTLSHLLVRRLAFESGYGASSLNERIFARGLPNQGVEFGGLLIYTAAGDAQGTLGGLVRQGEPERLLPTLLAAIDDAAWCSSDPLCSEQSTVSMDGLNLSSCHACTLVSETSCENGNFLLDRALVVGSGDVRGFFESVLAAGNA